MLQLKNNTPFAAQLGLFPDPRGIDTLYMMVRARFNIGPQWTLAEQQSPPQAEDVYWTDDPANSSLKLASEFHTGKPASDIVLVGHAWAPEGREIPQMDVGLSVGAVNKTIRVFGDRVWQDGRPTAPRPFSAMPLVYEKAFGGVFREQDRVIEAEERNPVGCGFTGQRKASQVNGQPLPNLEDPRQLLGRPGDRVMPASFGFIAPSWLPRRRFAGTYDEPWQKTRAPYLPLDFDARFFNMAHPDLVYPGYLTGGEPVRLDGVNPNGPLAFNLPVIGLSAAVNIGGRIERPVFNLETLLIEPDSLNLNLSWRAALPCDKQALKISRVIINLSRNHGQKAA